MWPWAKWQKWNRSWRTNRRAVEALPLYESPALREVTGPTLRPGGFTLTDRAVALCGLIPDAMALDAGCGLGATTDRLVSKHGIRTIGLDVPTSLFQEGRSTHSSKTLVGGFADRLPFGREIFDAVFCECVLSLLSDPGRALTEFHRVLRRGGWLVITDIYARAHKGASILKQLPLISCLKGARPRQELVDMVEGVGFQMVLCEDHTRLLKRLAAEIVFAYGSMQKFWTLFVPDGRLSELACGLEQARPGYWLMVGHKKLKAESSKLKAQS